MFNGEELGSVREAFILNCGVISWDELEQVMESTVVR